MSEDNLSFERVMRELQIEEEELKKLVSAGELRAFRDSDQMKFKKEDVERYLNSKKGGKSDADVIDLLDGDQGELELEEGASSESPGEELTEELSFDDVDLGDDVGMKTEPLSGDDLFATEDLDEGGEAAGEDLLIGEEEEGELLTEGEEVEALKRPVKRSRAAQPEEEETESPAMLGLMVISAIVLILGILVVMDIATSEPSPMVQWLVGIFKS